MGNTNDNSVNILKEEKRRLLERVATIDSLLELIEGKVEDPQPNKNSNDSGPDYSGYNARKSSRFKVVYIIKAVNRFLHSSEIRSKIARLEKIDYDSVNISPVLSQLKRDGKLCKVQVGNQNRNSFWGNPKWLNEAGEILPQYKYNENALSVNDSEEDIEF